MIIHAMVRNCQVKNPKSKTTGETLEFVNLFILDNDDPCGPTITLDVAKEQKSEAMALVGKTIPINVSYGPNYKGDMVFTFEGLVVQAHQKAA